MIIHLDLNQGILSRSINFIKQTFPSVEKVRSFSKSYIASYLSKALVASVALSCLNISFSTAFPISLALIVFISFSNFALKSIKKAMHALAQKSREFLTRIAQVISDIFEAICRFSSSFFSATIYLKEKAFTFNKKFSINQAVVVTNTEPFIKKDLQIQEDKQTVRLAISQREILSKFQLCAKKPNLLFLQKFYTHRPIFSTPKKLIAIIPHNTLPKSNRNVEAQGSIMAPAPSIPTPNLSSIRLGMKVLNLVRSIK